MESFNGRMRDEPLTETLFFGLANAKQEIAAWVIDYNNQRPHSALGYKTPAAFAANPNSGEAIVKLEPTTSTRVKLAAALNQAG